MGRHILELIYCMWVYSLLVLTSAWIIRGKPAVLCFSHFSPVSGSVTVSNDPAWGVNTPDINTTQYSTFLWCILHDNRGSFSYERVALHQESNLRKVDTVFMWSEAQRVDNNSFYIVCLYCMDWQDVFVAPISCFRVSTYCPNDVLFSCLFTSSVINWEEVQKKGTVQHDRADRGTVGEVVYHFSINHSSDMMCHQSANRREPLPLGQFSKWNTFNYASKISLIQFIYGMHSIRITNRLIGPRSDEDQDRVSQKHLSTGIISLHRMELKWF